MATQDDYINQYTTQNNPYQTGTNAYQRSLSAQLSASQAQRTQTGRSYSDLYTQAKSNSLMQGGLSGQSGLSGGMQSGYDAKRSAANVGALTDIYTQREAAMQQIGAQEAAAPMNALQEASAFDQYEAARQQQEVARLQQVDQIRAGVTDAGKLTDTQRAQLTALGVDPEEVMANVDPADKFKMAETAVRGVAGIAAYKGVAKPAIGAIKTAREVARIESATAAAIANLDTAGSAFVKIASQNGLATAEQVTKFAGLTDDVMKANSSALKATISAGREKMVTEIGEAAVQNIGKKAVTETGEKVGGGMFSKLLGGKGASFGAQAGGKTAATGALKVAGKALGIWGVVTTVDFALELMGVDEGLDGLILNNLDMTDEQRQKWYNGLNWVGL